MKNLIMLLIAAVGLGFAGSPQLLLQKKTNFGGNLDVPVGFRITENGVVIWGFQSKSEPGSQRSSAKYLNADFSDMWTTLDSPATMGLSGALFIKDKTSTLSSSDFYSEKSCLLFLDSNGNIFQKIPLNYSVALGEVDSFVFAVSPSSATAYNEMGNAVFSWPIDFRGSAPNTTIRYNQGFVWISSYTSQGRVFVEKRNKTNGNLVWKYEVSGVKTFGDLDSEGNFYMGFSKVIQDSMPILRYQAVKLDANGNEVWHKEWDARQTTLAKTQTFCRALTINENKNLIIFGGQIQKGENRMDGERSAYLAGLAMSTGELQWQNIWDYSGAWVSSVDGARFYNDELYVMSHSYSSSIGSIPNVIYLEKYKTDKVLGVGNPKAIPSDFQLYQNYPNPFNPSTTIRYSLPKQSYIRLAVYDLLGRELAVLVDGEVGAGEQEVRFDASNLSSGTYIYRLQTDGRVETKKMSLLK